MLLLRTSSICFVPPYFRLRTQTHRWAYCAHGFEPSSASCLACLGNDPRRGYWIEHGVLLQSMLMKVLLETAASRLSTCNWSIIFCNCFHQLEISHSLMTFPVKACLCTLRFFITPENTIHSFVYVWTWAQTNPKGKYGLWFHVSLRFLLKVFVFDYFIYSP